MLELGRGRHQNALLQPTNAKFLHQNDDEDLYGDLGDLYGDLDDLFGDLYDLYGDLGDYFTSVLTGRAAGVLPHMIPV